MSFSEKIRALQDNVRNSGWRIKHISFVEDGKFQTHPTTPLSNFFALSGLALIVISVICMVNPSPFTSFISRLGPVLSRDYTVLAGVAGFVSALVILMIGGTISNYMRCRRWLKIAAECQDKEIRDFHSHNHGTHWKIRTLCRFSYQGQIYQVTPEPSEMQRLVSQQHAEEFLAENSDETGRLLIWVNPGNPLETLIGKKPAGSYFVGIFIFLFFGVFMILFSLFLMNSK